MTEHEKTADDFREQRSRILHGLADRSRLRAPPSHLIWADLPAYESPIDGRIIAGRAQRREDLKRNGCREYDQIRCDSRDLSARPCNMRERCSRKSSAVFSCSVMIYFSAKKVIEAQWLLRHLKISGTGQVADESPSGLLTAARNRA